MSVSFIAALQRITPRGYSNANCDREKCRRGVHCCRKCGVQPGDEQRAAALMPIALRRHAWWFKGRGNRLDWPSPKGRISHSRARCTQTTPTQREPNEFRTRPALRCAAKVTQRAGCYAHARAHGQLCVRAVPLQRRRLGRCRHAIRRRRSCRGVGHAR